MKRLVEELQFIFLAIWNIVSIILVAMMIGLVFISVILYSFCVPFKDDHMVSDGVRGIYG